MNADKKADKKINLKEFNKFLRKHKTVNFRTVDLLNMAVLARLKLEKGGELHGQVKAYQRLLRCLHLRNLLTDSDEYTAETIAKDLLKLGIMSALQITAMGKKQFIENTVKVFSNDFGIAEKVYDNALIARKLVALKYINQRQNLEPYKRVAKV